jgi:hypothetical protein
MAQCEAITATDITIQDYDKALLNVQQLKQSLTKLLLLTQNAQGRTISERFVRTDASRFKEIISSHEGPQLWYNDLQGGLYLVDATDDTLMVKRTGHGLAIRLQE